MKINIRSSYDSFRELRENNSYYIDKTEIIEEYLARRFDKAVMFARPRRFGKTLTMTMFRDFLDIRQDSRGIFSGLKIMDYPDAVRNYMNQYPVVFLSLKEVFGDSFEKILKNYQIVISDLCMSYDELIDSSHVNAEDKTQLLKIRQQEASEENGIAVLSLLSRMLHDHYGKQVFVIIDEYDVPMAKALGTPYYDKVRDMIEHMLSFVCKTNDHVKAVMLSGCLYTVKNSAYTGVNNIQPYTILSPIYDMEIDDVTEDDLISFFASRINYSQSVLVKAYQMLQRIFKKAIQRKLITENPLEDIKCPRSRKKTIPVRALTIEEQKKLIKVLTTQDIRYGDAMLLSMFTGMRAGECTALKVEDIDLVVRDKMILYSLKFFHVHPNNIYRGTSRKN